MLGSNEIIGSDKCQLLSEWPVDKENGSATKEFKIARKWETFHLVLKWRVTSNMMYWIT